MILFLTKDLMVQSNASAAARKSGIQMRSVSSIDDAIKFLQSEPVSQLLIDLQTPGLAIDDVLQKLQSFKSKLVMYAFAQHVEEELLSAAKDGLFKAVLTRGQFVTRLPQIVAEAANSAVGE